MDKVLDLVDVFALGDTALHLLPIAIVVGGVIAVFIYGIKRSDSQQLQKTISKSVNAMKSQKPKKRSETPAKELKSSSEQSKTKEKKATVSVQQVKIQKVAATAAPKKSPAASKSSKTAVTKPASKDKPKAGASIKSPAVPTVQEVDGEWRTVITKRQKKQTPEEGAESKKPTGGQKKAEKIAKLPAIAVAKGAVPKLEDVIAAMSSQNNFALFEQAEEESTRAQRKAKTRALRE